MKTNGKKRDGGEKKMRDKIKGKPLKLKGTKAKKSWTSKSIAAKGFKKVMKRARKNKGKWKL